MKLKQNYLNPHFSLTSLTSRPPHTPHPLTPPALDAPRDLHVVGVTETTMSLEWKRPLAKLDAYRLVHVSADGHKAEVTVPGSSDTHTLRGLTSGMLYTVSITAERGRRTSAHATVSAHTGQCSPCPLPYHCRVALDDPLSRVNTCILTSDWLIGRPGHLLIKR